MGDDPINMSCLSVQIFHAVHVSIAAVDVGTCILWVLPHRGCHSPKGLLPLWGLAQVLIYDSRLETPYSDVFGLLTSQVLLVHCLIVPEHILQVVEPLAAAFWVPYAKVSTCLISDVTKMVL